MGKSSLETTKMMLSMVIFGTIGIFVRNIPLQSSVIALVRGVVGALFLLLVVTIQRKPISSTAVKRNLLWLCLSGICIGFNWILLFESYRYTSVAVSTLCYYMAPILVILASPFVLKERLTIKKGICVLTALAGMICISGVLDSGIPVTGELRGILLGLAAAALYAAVILLNKQLKDISAYDKTILQLGISALILIPYCILTYQPGEAAITHTAIILLLVIGIVHTGFAYYLYFGSMECLSGQSVAVISYIDPVVAVLVSVLLLNEPMKAVDLLGALLILGAALISEMPGKKKGGQS